MRADDVPAGGALRLEGVHKSYGKAEVLRGIDLEVAAHEVLCLIGASGSGKSTMLKCVNLLEPIDAGRIFVEGDEITADGVDVNRIRERIGIVFQAFNLFPHMTVLRNITLAQIKVRGASRQEAEDTARELLRRFGLEDKKDEYPDRLSGGQQQRVAIARALVMRPKAMLFDEPTSALDVELVREVLDVMEGLARDGMTMVVVSHELRFAHHVASSILMMDEGQVIEEAPPDRFFSAPSQERTKRFLALVE